MTDAAETDVIVIGAGAAGLFAAAGAARRGRRTLLLEKNSRPGVKILMSGGTRCNLTHAATPREVVAAFGPQGRFLHSALARLSPDGLVALVEAEGVATKIEPGGKVFPVSNRAVDVLNALLGIVRRSGAELRLGQAVRSIERASGGVGFVVMTTAGVWRAASVVVAVGGQSYPGSGTTGDGYAWAKSLGHRIVPPRPALAPLASPTAWVRALRGVAIEDAQVRIRRAGEKPIAVRRAALLLTHFGLSGPAAMDVSGALSAQPQRADWLAECDLIPATTEQELLDRWATAAQRNGQRSAAALLAELTPRRLAESLCEQAGVPADRRLAELSKRDRAALAAALKRTEIPLSGTRGFAQAEVTAGGVDLAEVDSRTMQSKLVAGLYFAGEILDLDGPIGGYNFQAAFSTGALAGDHA